MAAPRADTTSYRALRQSTFVDHQADYIQRNIERFGEPRVTPEFELWVVRQLVKRKGPQRVVRTPSGKRLHISLVGKKVTLCGRPLPKRTSKKQPGIRRMADCKSCLSRATEDE